MIRLDKFLADTGYGTRSKTKQLVRSGAVLINGEKAPSSDVKINPESDIVTVNGKTAAYEEFEYYMLNKPAGVISASTDRVEKTVVDLITEKKRRDLFPVGRLDRDTEGLLIITNDGMLANRLLAPGKHVDKVYKVIVTGRLDEEDVEALKEGLDIGDEKLTKPAVLSIIKIAEESTNDETTINVSTIDETIADETIAEETAVDETAFDETMAEDIMTEEITTEAEVTITEGRFHQVKRMFEARGHKVIYLKRLSMGRLKLDESLPTGEYRKLTEEEKKMLLN